MKKQFDLIIITTALNRSELHNICLGPIVKLLTTVNVKWLINIDSVGQEDSSYTESNLRDLLGYANIDLEIFKSEKPCFYNAVKHLTNKAKPYLSQTRYGVFQLEDDWPMKIDPMSIDFKSLLVGANIDSTTYISFSKNQFPDQLNFRPSIFSKHLFDVNYVGGFEANVYEPRDPELTVTDAAWIDEDGTRLESLKPTKIYNFDWFHGPDVGRKWVQDILKKRKWNKYNKGTGHKPMSNLTYY